LTPYRSSWQHCSHLTRSAYYNAHFPLTSPKQISVNKSNTGELLYLYSIEELDEQTNNKREQNETT